MVWVVDEFDEVHDHDCMTRGRRLTGDNNDTVRRDEAIRDTFQLDFQNARP